jgi:hypothetical protein
MIEMPSRSITRFFVPMIDVLTLLFCIYLLMPMVSDSSGESEASRRQREELLRQLEEERARKGKIGAEIPRDLLAEIEKLRREKAQALQSRLNVRVLEIDPADGKLYYRGLKGARIEVASEGESAELIKRDQERTGAEKRELYYLILYPRDPKSAFPTVGQKRAYDRWFKEIALGYDVPGLDLGRQP